MDEVMRLLRGRLVLCGQLLKLFAELIDLLKANSNETAEVLQKINDITKSLSQNAADSQKFLDGVKFNTISEFLAAQNKDIKRDLAERLLIQCDNFQAQLKSKSDTAAKLTEKGKKFADFTLNLMTQTQSSNTYGKAAEASAQSKRHIFDANV